MSDTTTGGCWCGKTRYEVQGEAKFSITCYCRDCQHISGGASLPQFATSKVAADISGPITTYKSKSDAGNDLELGFCSHCGSPIYKTTAAAPELIFFCAGSLDDPSVFDPGR